MKLFIQKHAFKLIVFFVALVLVLAFFIVKFIFLKNNTKNEVTLIVEKVDKHIFLPIGEVPSIATVTEPEKLKGQEFFINSKKGDKVLIYSNAKKAILYDPVADKIVTIAPITLDPSLQNNITINTPNQEF